MTVIPVRHSLRVAPLDAARGLAMLGVCISHFGLGIRFSEPALAANLWLVGMIASPTFIVLSGAILGYLISVRSDALPLLRVQLIDRGLFLLTVTHLAIDGAHYQRFHSLVNVAQALFMTDTIGVALILGVFIVPAMKTRPRMLAAAALYVSGWLLVLFWHPSESWLRLMKEAVVGSTNQYADIRQNFPLVPWVAVYLAATVLGQEVAKARREGSLKAIGRKLLTAGPLCIAGALAIKGVYLLNRPPSWRNYADMPPIWRDIYDLTTPFDKYPPGPTYLLAYGGLALMLIGMVIIATERRWVRGPLEVAAVVGRSSLFVFVIQFYLYYLLVPVLPIPHRWVLIPYFIASVFVLWVLGWSWGRMNGNSFFTLGITAAYRRRELRESGPVPPPGSKLAAATISLQADSGD